MDETIELERSEYVKHRVYLMKANQVPTISEAKSNLGAYLAQILFDQCDNALKPDFGLVPLKGTGDELWVSPSDLLIGKVALKPPLTSKHIQALTHQGILDIGEEVERKFWNETRMHEENYFDARKRYLMDQFEELFRVEAKNIEQRERLLYQNQIQRMIEEFDEILLEELDNLEEKLHQEQVEALKEQETTLNCEWEKKLKKQGQYTVGSLSNKFLNELERQKSLLTSEFQLELHKLHIQNDFNIHMEQVKCEENLIQLRHSLECKNIANMMYLLCLERRKCAKEKEHIEGYYLNEIENLTKTLVDKDKLIQTLTNEKNKQIREVTVRETCLLGIIREFQKFINFALRSAPTQAEFLLSVEKMMVFELANSVLKSDYSRLKTCNQILAWKHQVRPSKDSRGGNLTINDHHACLKELPHDESSRGLGVDDYLPAFQYKNKLYVREDFRNMISQGINITRSHELWSKDVEVLIDKLRKSISEIQLPTIISDQIKEMVSKRQSNKSVTPSSIHFIVKEDRPRKVSLAESTDTMNRKQMSTEKRSSLKPVLNSLQNIDFRKIGIVEKKPALIAAANSLELLHKKASLKHLLPSEELVPEKDNDENVDEGAMFVEDDGKINEIKKESRGSDPSVIILKKKSSLASSVNNKERRGSKQKKNSFQADSLVIEAKDSIILQKTSLLRKSTEFNVSPKDSIDVAIDSKIVINKKSSKLVTAKNSLELIRESKMMIGLYDNAPLCSPPKKESLKLKTTSSCIKNSKCPEKCYSAKSTLEEEELTDVNTRKNSAERSIKMSHIQVIKVEGGSKTNVSINVTPIIHETPSYSTDLTDMYRQEEKIKKGKKKPRKDKLRNLPKSFKVVGDKEAKEHLETTDEFTEHRIHSFIDLIKDNPALLRTFTACRR